MNSATSNSSRAGVRQAIGLADPLFRVRIVEIDYYMSSPTDGLDAAYSPFTSMRAHRVPIIRVFGTTPSGQKACLHVHGGYPYFFVPIPPVPQMQSILDDIDGAEPEDLDDASLKAGIAALINEFRVQFGLSLNEALDDAHNQQWSGVSGSVAASGTVSSAAPRGAKMYVHNVSLVRALPFYGYHDSQCLFFKVELYQPGMVAVASKLLAGGTVLQYKFDTFEAHISFVLHFLIDNNLFGMGYLDLSTATFRLPLPPKLHLPSTYSRCDGISQRNSDVKMQSSSPSQCLPNPPSSPPPAAPRESVRRSLADLFSLRPLHKATVPKASSSSTAPQTNEHHHTSSSTTASATNTRTTAQFKRLCDQYWDSVSTPAHLVGSRTRIRSTTCALEVDARAEHIHNRFFASATPLDDAKDEEQLVKSLAAIWKSERRRTGADTAMHGLIYSSPNRPPPQEFSLHFRQQLQTLISAELEKQSAQHGNRTAHDALIAAALAAIRDESNEVFDTTSKVHIPESSMDNYPDPSMGQTHLAPSSDEFARPLSRNAVGICEFSQQLAEMVHSQSEKPGTADTICGHALAPQQHDIEEHSNFVNLDGAGPNEKLVLNELHDQPGFAPDSLDDDVLFLLNLLHSPQHSQEQQRAVVVSQVLQVQHRSAQQEWENILDCSQVVDSISELSPSRIFDHHSRTHTHIRHSSHSSPERAANTIVLPQVDGGADSSSSDDEVIDSVPAHGSSDSVLETPTANRTTSKRKSRTLYDTPDAALKAAASRTPASAYQLAPETPVPLPPARPSSRSSHSNRFHLVQILSKRVVDGATQYYVLLRSNTQNALPGAAAPAACFRRVWVSEHKIRERQDLIRQFHRSLYRGGHISAGTAGTAGTAGAAASSLSDTKEVMQRAPSSLESVSVSPNVPSFRPKKRLKLQARSFGVDVHSADNVALVDSHIMHASPTLLQSSEHVLSPSQNEVDSISDSHVEGRNDDNSVEPTAVISTSANLQQRSLLANSSTWKPIADSHASSTSGDTSYCHVFQFQRDPPNGIELYASFADFELEPIVFQDAYFSNIADMPARRVQFGGVHFRARHAPDSIMAAPAFPSCLRGMLAHQLREFEQAKRLIAHRVPSVLDSDNHESANHACDTVITPARIPPSFSEVFRWSRHRTSHSGTHNLNAIEDTDTAVLDNCGRMIHRTVQRLDHSDAVIEFDDRRALKRNDLEHEWEAIQGRHHIDVEYEKPLQTSPTIASTSNSHAKSQPAVIRPASPAYDENFGITNISYFLPQSSGSHTHTPRSNKRNLRFSALATTKKSNSKSGRQSPQSSRSVRFADDVSAQGTLPASDMPMPTALPADHGVEPQFLTLLQMELHANTRGQLVPDPRHDCICAITYVLQEEKAVYHHSAGNGTNRIVRTSSKREYHVGAIVLSLPNKLTGAPLQLRHSLPTDEINSGDYSSSIHNVKVEYVDTEFDLVQRFTGIVDQYDPDILMGFEVQQLSWGFLIERASLALNMDLEQRFSRIASPISHPQPVHHHATGTHDMSTSVGDNDRSGAHHLPKHAHAASAYNRRKSSDLRISGRIVMNIWRIMRKELKLNVYTLENVVFHTLQERLPHYSFSVLTKWFGSISSSSARHIIPGVQRWRTVQYMIDRCCGVVRSVERLAILARTSELARVFGIKFFSVLTRGSQYRVESMMMRLARSQNYLALSPTRSQVANQPAMECMPLIMEPVSALYSDPVIVLDFQSLYPSVIIAYNICFSTCLGKVPLLTDADQNRLSSVLGVTHVSSSAELLQKLFDWLWISPNGVMFVRASKRKGLLPRLLREILDTRYVTFLFVCLFVCLFVSLLWSLHVDVVCSVSLELWQDMFLLRP
jgi:DNA polymerase elongation subunit (family B)